MTPIQSLTIVDLALGPSGLRILADAINDSGLRSLSTISFEGNALLGISYISEGQMYIQTDPSGFVAFCGAIGGCSSMTELDLGTNPFYGSAFGRSVADMVTNSSSLKKFGLRGDSWNWNDRGEHSAAATIAKVVFTQCLEKLAAFMCQLWVQSQAYA